MQSISFDILNEVGPITRGLNRISVFKRLRLFFIKVFFLKRVSMRMEKQLDKLILLCEGMSNHIRELDEEGTLHLYKDVQTVIVSMEKGAETVFDFPYTKDLQDKMQLALKFLYRIEARLEIKMRKSEKSGSGNDDSEIQKAISGIGRQSIARTLEKDM